MGGGAQTPNVVTDAKVMTFSLETCIQSAPTWTIHRKTEEEKKSSAPQNWDILEVCFTHYIRRDSLAARAGNSLCSRQHAVGGNVFSCLIVHNPRRLPLSCSPSLSRARALSLSLSLVCLSDSLVSMLSPLLSVLSCDLSST
jgi:hypothetical protein